MKMLVCLALLAVAGCATARLVPAGVSGNETYVMISNVWGPGEALPYATKHCAQYGKVPQLKDSQGYTARFDCVAP